MGVLLVVHREEAQKVHRQMSPEEWDRIKKQVCCEEGKAWNKMLCRIVMICCLVEENLGWHYQTTLLNT